MAYFVNDPVATRRALVLALSDYLESERVREAITLWHHHFENSGSIFVGLNRYCRQVAQAFGLSGKEAELHLKIFRALQAAPDTLPPDPLSRPSAVEQPRASAAASGSARTLAAFFAEIEALVAREPGLSAGFWRRAALARANALPGPARLAVGGWWRGELSSLGGDWPAGGLGTALVNVIYVALADLLGPVRADQCFTQAVGRLEASDDPALRSIRQYL